MLNCAGLTPGVGSNPIISAMSIFNNVGTTVSQGAVGLAFAIAYYQQTGYMVSIPLVDNTNYDLIIEKNSVFESVQVKTTRVIKNNNYLVQLKKVRSNKTKNTISPMSKVDYLFILCDNGDKYSIPFNKLTSLNELRTSLYQNYKIN